MKTELWKVVRVIERMDASDDEKRKALHTLIDGAEVDGSGKKNPFNKFFNSSRTLTLLNVSIGMMLTHAFISVDGKTAIKVMEGDIFLDRFLVTDISFLHDTVRITDTQAETEYILFKGVKTLIGGK